MINKIKSKLQAKFHRTYKQLEIKEHQLLYLFLEITRKCNLNCLHCGSDCKADANAAELTTDSWLKIIDYISENFSPELVFVITGGEPTVHKDLLKIVKNIQKNNRRWGMVTNGMNMTKDRMDKLIDAGLYSITLSLDGLEKSHNKLRNHPKAFEKVLNALSIVGNSTVNFKDAVTCVYPDNLYELDKIAEILIEKKITTWRLFRIFESGRAYNNPITQMTFEQTQIMLEWIKNNKKKYEKRGLNLNLSCEGWLPFDYDKQLRDNPFFCRSGVNMASVLCDGNITGCSNNDESFYVGNVLRDSFSYVWENKFSDFRERNWINNTICKQCEHVKDCQGGSIHLWKLGDEKPKFCYAKKISDL